MLLAATLTRDSAARCGSLTADVVQDTHNRHASDAAVYFKARRMANTVRAFNSEARLWARSGSLKSVFDLQTRLGAERFDDLHSLIK